MKVYVVETINRARYIISEKEKEALFLAIANRETHAILQGDMIPLSAPPSVVLFERWYAKEVERLAVSQKRLCKKCLKVIGISDRCPCWDSENGKSQNAFIALPQEITVALRSAIRSFPSLAKADEARIEFENSQFNKPKKYIQQGGELVGHIDEETGEEMFS